MKFIMSGAVTTSLMLINASLYAQEATNRVDSEMREVLNRFVGTWEKSITVHPSVWIPDEQTKTGTHTTTWILDDHHLQEQGVDSDGQKYLAIMSCGQASDEFQYLFVQNNENAPQAFTGEWYPDDNALVFRASVADGITMVTTYKFVSDDSFELTVVATDRGGQIFYRLTATATRVRR